MNVEIYAPLLPNLFSKLVPYSASPQAGAWEDVYVSIAFLKQQFPDCRFKREPYHYLDLQNQKAGLIFIEEQQEQLYFVYP